MGWKQNISIDQPSVAAARKNRGNQAGRKKDKDDMNVESSTPQSKGFP